MAIDNFYVRAFYYSEELGRAFGTENVRFDGNDGIFTVTISHVELEVSMEELDYKSMAKVIENLGEQEVCEQ